MEAKTKSDMAKAFEALIDKLIAAAPEQLVLGDAVLPNTGEGKAVECQVSLANGAMMAGALSWEDRAAGVIRMKTPMRKGNQTSGKISLVDMYFTSEAVFSVTCETPKERRSGLVTPGGLEVVS